MRLTYIHILNYNILPSNLHPGPMIINKVILNFLINILKNDYSKSKTTYHLANLCLLYYVLFFGELATTWEKYSGAVFFLFKALLKLILV